MMQTTLISFSHQTNAMILGGVLGNTWNPWARHVTVMSGSIHQQFPQQITSPSFATYIEYSGVYNAHIVITAIAHSAYTRYQYHFKIKTKENYHVVERAIKC